MGKVRRLATRQELDERAAFAAAADVLAQLPPQALVRLSAHQRAAISTARRALRDRTHAAESIWPGGYNMISRVQAKHVHDLIRQLPSHKRPVQVRDAFMLVLFCIDQDTAELPFTREELAREIGCAPGNVSKIMGTLEELGVLERQRRPEAGYRGRGRVVYVVNVHTAWNGNHEFRKKLAAAQTPPTERAVPPPAKRAKLKLVPPAEAAE